MIRFFLLATFGFAGMEIFSYLVHRFLFHGIFWRIHQTHHKPNKFFLELNDIFSLIFALAAIALMIFGNVFAFPIGLGITLYGIVYFITHDFFTHRRFLSFGSKNKILLTIRRAHRRHHQSVEKRGIEPFGLFVFNFVKFRKKISS
ncbi:MAG: sterol desaturase family protein [Pyrinomonadaceae bacterium]